MEVHGELSPTPMVQKTDKFGDVFELMTRHAGTHRVFLVDQEKRVLGVINFKDALGAILRVAEAPSPPLKVPLNELNESRGGLADESSLPSPVARSKKLSLTRTDSTRDCSSKVMMSLTLTLTLTLALTLPCR